ncbi:GNAT family N-acetyltransferase [Actinoplanes solisilvae]|uniref:GNAT family N-acetyltransferase n=1 Tax=Actinoplanes solisilvae TaxID=2486853 RepID=UPI000FD8E5FE|nr:GNAT family N-acetyltransferase [Actinoplanes solisilvae]
MRISTGPLTSPEIAYDISTAVERHEWPDIPVISRTNFLAVFDNPPPGQTRERYLGYLDGKPVGFLVLRFPELDNVENVEIALQVRPECRRQGVGRALFDLAVERARARGRKHVQGETVDRHPGGRAFAQSVGARAGLSEVRSRLDLTTLDEPRLAELMDDAWKHAEGYRLKRWVGVPPDDVIDGVAYLESRMNADAPIGDMNWEPERMDAERIRQAEQARARRGRIGYQAGALIGDRLAAWTYIGSDVDEPAHAWQSTTIVDPDHRGHRLGLLVKIHNLAHVRELKPSLQMIDTFNAAENTFMIRVNQEMGFRAVDALIDWQVDL